MACRSMFAGWHRKKRGLSPPAFVIHGLSTIGPVYKGDHDSPTAGSLSDAIESHLMGLAEGDHVTLALAPGEAFGPRNPDMLQWVPRALLDKFGEAGASYVIGEVVEFPAPDGQGRYAGAVQQVADDAVLFDFNHPLAGQAVSLEVKVIGVL